MTKQIRVKLGYNGLSDKDVATQGVAVVDGMTNNPKFVNPPVNRNFSHRLSIGSGF